MHEMNNHRGTTDRNEILAHRTRLKQHISAESESTSAPSSQDNCSESSKLINNSDISVEYRNLRNYRRNLTAFQLSAPGSSSCEKHPRVLKNFSDDQFAGTAHEFSRQSSCANETCNNYSPCTDQNDENDEDEHGRDTSPPKTTYRQYAHTKRLYNINDKTDDDIDVASKSSFAFNITPNNECRVDSPTDDTGVRKQDIEDNIDDDVGGIYESPFAYNIRKNHASAAEAISEYRRRPSGALINVLNTIKDATGDKADAVPKKSVECGFRVNHNYVFQTTEDHYHGGDFNDQDATAQSSFAYRVQCNNFKTKEIAAPSFPKDEPHYSRKKRAGSLDSSYQKYIKNKEIVFPSDDADNVRKKTNRPDHNSTKPLSKTIKNKNEKTLSKPYDLTYTITNGITLLEDTFTKAVSTMNNKNEHSVSKGYPCGDISNVKNEMPQGDDSSTKLVPIVIGNNNEHETPKPLTEDNSVYGQRRWSLATDFSKRKGYKPEKINEMEKRRRARSSRKKIKTDTQMSRLSKHGANIESGYIKLVCPVCPKESESENDLSPCREVDKRDSETLLQQDDHADDVINNSPKMSCSNHSNSVEYSEIFPPKHTYNTEGINPNNDERWISKKLLYDGGAIFKKLFNVLNCPQNVSPPSRPKSVPAPQNHSFGDSPLIAKSLSPPKHIYKIRKKKNPPNRSVPNDDVTIAISSPKPVTKRPPVHPPTTLDVAVSKNQGVVHRYEAINNDETTPPHEYIVYANKHLDTTILKSQFSNEKNVVQEMAPKSILLKRDKNPRSASKSKTKQLRGCPSPRPSQNTKMYEGHTPSPKPCGSSKPNSFLNTLLESAMFSHKRCGSPKPSPKRCSSPKPSPKRCSSPKPCPKRCGSPKPRFKRCESPKPGINFKTTFESPKVSHKRCESPKPSRSFKTVSKVVLEKGWNVR